MLEGEAGIGKTHLVGELRDRADHAGFRVVEAPADEVVRRPGALAHGFLDAGAPTTSSWSRLHALLAAPPDGSESEDLSYAAVEACIEVVEGMARSDPVLVIAEDLHWADDLSLGVLVALIRRVGVSRFGVVGSLRPTPRSPTLDRLLEVVRAGAGHHLLLGSLDEVDVHGLASVLTGAAPGPELRERIGTASGNPLFVTELLHSLDDDGLLRVESGIVDVAPEPSRPPSTTPWSGASPGSRRRPRSCCAWRASSEPASPCTTSR